jgi:TolA-binding protein
VQVQEIVWGDAPEAFSAGLEFLEKGDYENAVQSFKLAAGARRVRDWIKLYPDFYAARALLAWGEKDSQRFSEALAVYERLAKDHAESRLAPEILLNIGICLLKMKDYSRAESVLREYEKKAFDDTFPMEWQVRAKEWNAILSEEKGDFRIASNKWKSLEEFASNNNLLKIQNRAIIAQGRSLLKSENYAQAEEFFSKLLDTHADNGAIMAGAHNGLGECYFQKKDMRRAYVEFCKVRALFFDSQEEKARATYWAALCADELANQIKRSSSSFKTLARSYREELKKNYPETEWAKKD